MVSTEYMKPADSIKSHYPLRVGKNIRKDSTESLHQSCHAEASIGTHFVRVRYCDTDELILINFR